MKHESDILKKIKSYFMRRRSAKEAHAFEREVERDAFLYEAIEGYEDMLTSDIQQALDELDDRLDEKTTQRAFVWRWQIAATLAVIVIGAGVFTYLGQQKSTEAESVVSSSEEEGEDPVVEQSYQPRSGVPVFSTSDPLPTDQDQDSLGDPAEDIAAVEQAESEKVIATPEKSVEEAAQVNPSEPAVAMVEDKAAANRLDSPMNRKATADQAEDLAVASGSTANFTAPASSDLSKEATAKRTEASSEADQTLDVESASTPNAEPEDGMAAYQRYLSNALQRTPGMPSGKVVLSFEFDRDGKPRKVEVVESLCTACDMEAIRVIEEGPAWKVEDRKQRQRIEVSFK